MAKWKTASLNDLPDSAFLIVLPGGKQDETGRTVPRLLRTLPYKNASGKIDRAYVQSALTKLSQVNASAAVKRAALKKGIRIARALGMNAQELGKFNLSDLDFYLEQLEKIEEK
jgi:hypothetical protein